MTQIDFYVLQEGSGSDRFELACRIASKALTQQQRVLIHSTSDADATRIDRLLWTYTLQSFVPHGLLGQADPQLNPILIGDGGNDQHEADVLINLDAQVPAFFGRFRRMIECIDQDPLVKAAGRDRFRYYREHGYPLNTHPIER